MTYRDLKTADIYSLCSMIVIVLHFPNLVASVFCEVGDGSRALTEQVETVGALVNAPADVRSVRGVKRKQGLTSEAG